MHGTASARIGGLIVLTVACVAGAEVSVGTQPGHTGWTVSLVVGSLLYHPFTAGRLTPYGLLGASLARLSTGRAGAETEVDLAVDFGGGIWLRVARPLALRADVRFIHIDDAPNFWRAVAGITVAP